MNKKKCIITTKGSNIKNVNNYDLYYIEDYIDIVDSKEARLLTDDFFRDNKDIVDFHKYKKFPIIWIWYERIYSQYRGYLQIKELINVLIINGYQVININNIKSSHIKCIKSFCINSTIKLPGSLRLALLTRLKEFLKNLTLIIFSILSIAFIKIRGGYRIGIWTGDFCNKINKCDQRLLNLYNTFYDNDIRFIEFIRSKSLKDFIVNFFCRRRPAIYYESFDYFINFFQNKKKYFYSNKPLVSNYQQQAILAKKAIYFFEKLLIKLSIDRFCTLSLSSRSGYLHIAAKSANIKTIGIMHGIAQKEYLVNEFMEGYSGKFCMGTDVFGVWSEYYMKLYKENSKVVCQSALEISGPISRINKKLIDNNPYFHLINESRIKLLFISDPLVDVEEALPFLKKILSSKKFDVAIKIRPEGVDKFYNQLVVTYPKAKSIPVKRGNVLVDGLEFDAFIGFRSTATIDACIINKLSIFIDSNEWGDYFDIRSNFNNAMLCSEVDEINNHILDRVNNENQLQTISNIRKMFYGECRDSSAWFLTHLVED